MQIRTKTNYYQNYYYKLQYESDITKHLAHIKEYSPAVRTFCFTIQKTLRKKYIPL